MESSGSSARRLATLARQLTLGGGGSEATSSSSCCGNNACCSSRGRGDGNACCCGGGGAAAASACCSSTSAAAARGDAACCAPSPSSPPSNLPLKISPEVQRALASGAPVVALESTIISHGMPYPQNLATAREVEAVVRSAGATPATIAIIAGEPCVGLDDAQLERIARGGSKNVLKVSRRDLPLALAARRDGATTVSATMLLAARAGIDVFVTGGIGGVHRGAESTMDVSADLTELGRTPVAVVCAGAKSVLDIPRTLEVLETQGVAVAAYGADQFPAFFSRSSGCRAPSRVDTPEQAAAMVDALRALALGSGMLLAVPIPAAAEAAGAAVEAAVAEALREADAEGVRGAAITPFLLERVRSKTGGASLVANVALVKNNALVGARVAAALAERRRRRR